MKWAVLSLLLLCCPAVVWADDIHVPIDQPTIQAGIDAAVDGDSVIVLDGTYTGEGNKNLDFYGKAITVRSLTNPWDCWIDCEGEGRAFVFQHNEGPDSVVSGFTIANGRAPDTPGDYGGGGIRSEYASPTIRGNTFQDCQGGLGGGDAILCYDGNPVISRNVIRSNGQDENDEAVLLRWSVALVEGNRIEQNFGSGIELDFDYFTGSDAPTLTGNTICENGGDGIRVVGDYNGVQSKLVYNEICLNGGSGILLRGDSRPTISWNRIHDNGNGGILVDGGESGGTISHNYIAANEADEGGGIYIDGYCEFTISSNLIVDNRAQLLGGGIYALAFNTLIRGNTIVGNSALQDAAGIWCIGRDNTTIIDSIIWDNTCPTGIQVYGAEEWYEPTLNISYCNIDGGAAAIEVEPGCTYNLGAGLIDADPLFVTGPAGDLQTGSYYLSQVIAGQSVDSPCVDSGDPTVDPAWGTTRTDLVFDQQRADMGFHRSGPCRLVTGPGPSVSNPPLVRIFYPLDSVHLAEFSAYGASAYGVNVSCGDVDGDGVDEIITGAGPGAIYGPHVRCFGKSESGNFLPLVDFLAYGTLKFGVNVAAGDIDGDGADEFITGAGPGAVFGPHVRAFNFVDPDDVMPVPRVSYFAYGTPKWGVNVSAGDIDGDGYDEIVTGAGPGAVYGPHVRGWNVDGGPATSMPGCSFFAYGTLKYGVNVTCGDVDGDGIDEIVTGPGPSSFFGAHVRAFDMNGTPLPGLSFFAWDSAIARYGAKVFAGADLDGDGRDEIMVGCGPDPDPDVGTPVKVYRYTGSGEAEWFSLEAFPGMTHGTTVAAGRF